MTFSIVTPSYNSSRWLKLCISSVADQGVDLEHIVQDGGSTDDTPNWAPLEPRIRFFSEPDRGMYDAINKALRKSSGDILAYLNCDEQYLPGALKAVQTFFQDHPEVDVLFADALVVDPSGSFLAFRKAVLPLAAHTRVGNCLAVLTCATFFRRKVLQAGCTFNPDLRSVGDADWVLRLIQGRFQMALLRKYTSVFTETGQNLSLNAKVLSELHQFQSQAPAWQRYSRKLINLHHHFRRALAGAYKENPLQYAIYTAASNHRHHFHVPSPHFRWRR